MAALPYIQLYVADYLADTVHLTAEEHGAYLLLIFNYWQTGKPIPIDRLQAITKTNGTWPEVEKKLKPYFTEDNGCWLHERIKDDLEFVKSKSIKASRAGRKSAEARALKSKENPTDVQQPPCTPLNHTDTDTEADTEKPKHTSKAIASVPFDEIVNLYHKTLPNNPRIAKLSVARKAQIKARWNNGIGDLDAWERYFNLVSESKFLTGQAPPGKDRTKPFIADIDFLIKENNVLKIVENKYHE